MKRLEKELSGVQSEMKDQYNIEYLEESSPPLSKTSSIGNS